MFIGSHVSFKKDTQFLGSINESLSYGSTAFMFYTGAPQNTMRSAINEDITNNAHELLKEKNIKIDNIIVHAPYIINLANEKNKDFAISFLREEINRVMQLGVKKLVLHPGSHVGAGIEKGIENIASSLNSVLKVEDDILICLETMAGKGSEIGSNFNEIKEIISKVDLKDKIAVCLDTCHLNDSGYNLNNFDEILKEFDEVIGIEKIAVVHVNDSKNDLGAKKDRHENIGFGTLGFTCILNIINNDKLKDVPKILETPYINKLYPPYKFEIEMLLKSKFNENLIEDIEKFYK